MARRESSNVTVYVYCVLRSASRPSAARVPAGIPGATRPQPFALSGKLWFVAAEAPSAMYGEDAVNAGLRDLDWVSRIAVGHEAVVEHFTRRRTSTVIPMKLLTLFSSIEKAREELLGRRHEIASSVRRIAGCEEWGVRVFAGAASRPSGRAARRGAASRQKTGTAFLTARKAARDSERDLRARSLVAAERAYGTLAKLSRAARQRGTARDAGATPPVLDAAFLVAHASRARFRAAARNEAARLADAGAQMTLTGPWPAYNFVGDDGETT